MAQANVKLTVDASQATRALKNVQNQSTGLQKNLGRLKAAFAGVAVTAIGRQAVGAAANFQALQLRMKVLTSEFGEFNKAQELVAKAQDKFNLSIVEATKGVTDIFARLRPLGISLKEIETTFIGFNTIAKLAGLNATEASAAFTQLAQGLGSGRLQGDEFRSIAEQVPQLLKAISDETGIATGKLKEFAADGLLTSDIVLRALAKSAEEGADKIGEIMAASPTEVFKAFNNAVLELQLSLGSKLLPVVLAVTKATTALVEEIVRFVDSEAAQVTAIFIGTAAAIKGVSVVAPILIAQAVTLGNTLVGVGVSSALASKGMVGVASASYAASVGISKATIAANAFKFALAKSGIGLVVVGLGFLATALLKASNAQKEFNKLLDEGSTADINEQIKLTTIKINNLEDALDNVGKGRGGKAEELRLNRQLEKAKKKVEELKSALGGAENRELTREFNIQLEALKNQNAELTKSVKRSQISGEEKKKEFDLEQQIAEIRRQFDGEEEERLVSLAKQNFELQTQKDEYDKINESAKKLKETVAKIGIELEQNIKDNLAEAIVGAQSFGNAMNNILNSIKRKLVDLALDRLFEGFQKGFNKEDGGGGIGGFIGGFVGSMFKERGGPVKAGGAYVVGERGPEILQMGSRGGNIIPNSKLRGGGDSITNIINVSVDASGSSVQGDSGMSQELGDQIAIAIRQTLVDEKRAGGILA